MSLELWILPSHWDELCNIRFGRIFRAVPYLVRHGGRDIEKSTGSFFGLLDFLRNVRTRRHRNTLGERALGGCIGFSRHPYSKEEFVIKTRSADYLIIRNVVVEDEVLPRRNDVTEHLARLLGETEHLARLLGDTEHLARLLDNIVYVRDYYIKDFKYISPEALPKKVPEPVNRKPLEIWLREVFKGLKQFFCDGSLHGVKYIFDPTFSIKERLTWVVIMIVSIAICAVNIIQLFCKWTSTPFVNVIDSVPSPIWAVPFPTVVLCPHLHVKLSYENVSELDENEKFYASLVCPRMMNTIFTKERLDMEQIHLLQDFIVKASFTCDDVVKSCNWPAVHGPVWRTKNCCELFQPIFTNYGLCFAFNSLPLNGMTNKTIQWQKFFNENVSTAALKWGLDSGYPKDFPPNPAMQPFRVRGSGEANGLGLELFLNISEHQFACDGNSLGFTVLVSSPTDHVYTSTVLRLPMDRMTTVEVSPLTYRTDASLRSLNPGTRQCFFQSEKQLDYYEFYTDSNCKHERLVTEAKKTCQCVLFNWPRITLWEPICSTKDDYECIHRIRAEVEEQMLYAFFTESDEQGQKSVTNTSCFPSCNDIIYTSQVFYSDLTKDLDYTRYWGQPRIGEVTQINVHFYDDMFLGQHRHAQYDHYYFAGAIGGLLSLFLGFSIISVAEIVYFVILRPFYVVLKETLH